MQQFRVVHEEHERGRTYSVLRGVQNFQPAPVVRGRLGGKNGVAHHVVEQSRGYAPARLFVRFHQHIQRLFQPLSRLCGHISHAFVVHEFKLGIQLPVECVYRVRILFHQIPLVHQNDGRFVLFVRIAAYLHVLFAYPLARVDDDKAHVRPSHRRQGAHYRILLHALVHAGFFAHAGGVYYREFSALAVGKRRVYRVARSARHVADYHPFISQKLVGYRTFSRVRLTYDGYFYAVVLFAFFRRGKALCYLVKQIAQTLALFCGNADNLVHSQLVKVVYLVLFVVVQLVYRDYNGLFALAQILRHVPISRGKSRLAVHEQNYHVGKVYRNIRLHANMHPHLVFAFNLQPARVDKRESMSAPLRVAVHSVARDAGHVLHNGYALARQFIKERGFAHIGSAHNGYGRFHIFIALYSVNDYTI